MRTGRAFPSITLLVMSTLMPLSGITLPAAEQVAPSAEVIEQPMLRDVQQQTMTATDGTPFVITRAIVSVPELRGAPGKRSGSIELAVVRARRADAAVASRGAHVVLAGGPGDSGVALVLNTVQRGGAALGELFDGDIVGIDQRGTGKSSPNLSSAARYGLPLDERAPQLGLLTMMREVIGRLTRTPAVVPLEHPVSKGPSGNK